MYWRSKRAICWKAGAATTPAFQQIARFDLQYMEVPPDAPSRP